MMHEVYGLISMVHIDHTRSNLFSG